MPSSVRSAGHAPHMPAVAFRESGFLNVPRLPRFGRTPSRARRREVQTGRQPSAKLLAFNQQWCAP